MTFSWSGMDWTPVTDDYGSKGRTWCRSDPTCVDRVPGGVVLRVKADYDKRASESGPWVKTGVIESVEHFTYGYFEATMRFPWDRPGAHGCFWLQTTEDYIPGQAEIDVAEYGGVRPKVWHNVYWREPGMGIGEFAGVKSATELTEEQVHAKTKWGVEWLPDQYVFYRNRKVVAAITRGLSDRPKKLMLSMLVADHEADDLSGRLRDYRLPVRSVDHWERRPW